MKTYQQAFIELAIEHDVLRFGDFTLKSGRKSPYFFNAGYFNSGKALSVLGQCYAEAMQNHNIEADLLFGPAYKGISIASSVASSLWQQYAKNVPVCFNRKEIKTHGEGGQLMGAELQGRVTIVDDVITAGTAIGEVMDLIEPSDATVTHVVVGLDRQETNESGISAIEAVEAKHSLKVESLIKLDDVIAYLDTVDTPYSTHYAQLVTYRAQHQVAKTID